MIPPDSQPANDDPAPEAGGHPPGQERITPDMVGPALIGHTINQLYRVEKVLGEGGMGCVMQVLHLRLLRREAMKVPMKEFMVNAEYMQRFRREALTMARFEHPNIVQVYDVHIAENIESDISYITMEFVDGMAIDQFVFRHQDALTVGDLMGILAKLAKALDKAHEKHVIHRDIKPANIFIRSADQEPKLMDFGVARADIASAYKTNYSTTGANNSSFTAAYAAPEQIMGKPVTGAADVYAFAVTVYKLLCRAFPFNADNATAFILAHVQAAPIPVQEKNGHWPDGVNTAIMRAMSKAPEARHAFASDLVSEIANACQGLEHLQLSLMYNHDALPPQPGLAALTKTDQGALKTPPLPSKRGGFGVAALFIFLILLVGTSAYFVMDGKGAAFRAPRVYFPELRNRINRATHGDGMAALPVWETATPSPTATATPSPSPSTSPSPLPSETPAPTATALPVVIPPTATAAPSPTRTPVPTLTPVPSPTETSTPAPSPTASPEPTVTPVPTPKEIKPFFAVSPDNDTVAIIILDSDTVTNERLESVYPRRAESFLTRQADILNNHPADPLAMPSQEALIFPADKPMPLERVQWVVEDPTQALRLAGEYMRWYEASVKDSTREVPATKLLDQITCSITPSLLDSTAMPNRSLSIPGCWSVEDGTWKWRADRYSRIDARGRTDQRLERVPLVCFNTP